MYIYIYIERERERELIRIFYSEANVFFVFMNVKKGKTKNMSLLKNVLEVTRRSLSTKWNVVS